MKGDERKLRWKKMNRKVLTHRKWWNFIWAAFSSQGKVGGHSPVDDQSPVPKRCVLLCLHAIVTNENQMIVNSWNTERYLSDTKMMKILYCLDERSFYSILFWHVHILIMKGNARAKWKDMKNIEKHVEREWRNLKGNCKDMKASWKETHGIWTEMERKWKEMKRNES